MRVQYDEMVGEFERVLVKYGLSKEKAKISARLFAEASLDGVYTHGLNRFPKFITSVKNGSVHITAEPSFEGKFGSFERWNGNKGPGNLNALSAMERSIALAKEHVFGCVTLSNTNHWMRPGAYGLLAAKENCIGILWTNTVPNMPPWGAKDAHLGNNPMVVAIPHGEVPVLLDVAMSMFSYGKLEMYNRLGKELPIPGGFDSEGNMTTDPGKILETHQVFPIGYWKGSGLSLVLDLICATLSGGKTSYEIGKLPNETELSQIFIAINLDAFPDKNAMEEKIEASLQDLKRSIPQIPGQVVRFPGEGMVKTREENTRLGIPVDDLVWKGVKAL
ncbi:malate/lactate dehydrogenase [Sphaerochaeta pleomorpha str. Grapes]|uniref:Malate/lactate dehydrogenase n=1 Tax=Sphaerochaeta pleomorpha (strain ATCC BAA-1885 / DSM 22778 / Grapes) TaxID=158190 RepID=G8QXN3_SPHPG|nr:3-dehydro-L-gulonate 2-dehydrogenase [Sphaerochaeta pleomorpha]AEV29596.1 malate/lactate dehydrogenase [Sphaerochaeta pleomorpha str. Grapes]